MYKLTFQDNTTASLIKLNDQFVLAQPELSQETHAALCLFLPNEEKADNEHQFKLGDHVVVIEGTQKDVEAKVTKLDPLTVLTFSGHEYTIKPHLLQLHKDYAPAGRTNPIIVPQAFQDYRRGDEVLYETPQELSAKNLGVITSTAKDSVRVTLYTGLAVLITKSELIKSTGNRMEDLYSKGARVVFQAGQLQGQQGIIDYPSSSASYSIYISDTEKVDYPANHLKLASAEVILPITKDANNQLGVQVKTKTAFANGDVVLVRLPDNSVTRTVVLDGTQNMVKCKWAAANPNAYFQRAQLTKIKPEGERRREMEDAMNGDKLLVVVGDDVAGNARREGSLLLGDIVTFDRWVTSSEGHMLVKLVDRDAYYRAEFFQQTE